MPHRRSQGSRLKLVIYVMKCQNAFVISKHDMFFDDSPSSAIGNPLMILNPQQQLAVDHGSGPLLILAGPGSGKTRVLVHRIARLVQTGVCFPSQILAVTFTNKAAGEMKNRIEQMIGGSAREISAGTFHSISLKLLRRHAETLGYSDRFVVFDESDQEALIKECLTALNIDREKMPPRSVAERISRAKDSCQGPEEFAKAAVGNPWTERIARIYERYQARLKELSAMDFGDLIRNAVVLLEKNESILNECRRRWLHILVDEYQDTNHAQYRFIKLLAEGHQNISAVGDPDQSIYRWRGADVSNILRFEQDFPGATIIPLEQNYRSTKAILAAAQGVVARNAGRKAKSIWTENASGDRILIIASGSEREEATSVAERIVSACRGELRYGDIPLFYRTNAQSRPFEDVFRSAGIPYRIFGGIRFYERSEVKDILAYLRLIVDPRDDISLKRIINIPARGIGKRTVEKLELFARDRQQGMLELIVPFAASGSVSAAAAKRLTDFSRLISALSEYGESAGLSELVKNILEKSGYIEVLVSAGTIESEARIENINQLVEAVEEFVPQEVGSPVAEFLDQVALVSGADTVDDQLGVVTMMTLHLAKGLEFPSVFIVGMEEGIFPHARSLDDPDELEEERRLCYVGMTRAKRSLTLSHAFRRKIFGREQYNVASRFLDEIPTEHVARLASHVAHHTPPVARFAARDDFDFDQRLPGEQPSPFAKGLRVRHPTFGVGIIHACERTSTGHKVIVRFSDGNIKKLIAEFAGLTPA